MITCMDLAKKIASKVGTPIDHLKFQKLGFYAHAWYLAIFEEPLIDGYFVAQEKGPNNTELSHAYNAIFGTSAMQLDYSGFKLLDDKTDNFIDIILDHYKNFSGDALSEQTHSEQAWLDAFSISTASDDVVIIAEDSITKCYKKHSHYNMFQSKVMANYIYLTGKVLDYVFYGIVMDEKEKLKFWSPVNKIISRSSGFEVGKMIPFNICEERYELFKLSHNILCVISQETKEYIMGSTAKIINAISMLTKKRTLQIRWEHTKTDPDILIYSIVDIGLFYSAASLEEIRTYVLSFMKEMAAYFNETFLDKTSNDIDKQWFVIERLYELYETSPKDFMKLLKLDGIYDLREIDGEEFDEDATAE